MRVHEVAQLLVTIEALSARAFPSTAAEAWHEILATTDHADALQAVREFFGAAELPRHNIHPGYVRSRAAAIRDRREVASRHALERGGGPGRADPATVPAVQEVRRKLAALAGHLGDLDRPMRPDTSSSTLADDRRAAEMEDERRRQLDAVRLMTNAA
jgi:hypothetical protein